MKKLILILMLCFAVGAAQLESTGNGTTDGTNWTGGVTPANGDTLTIRSADSIALPSGDSIYATVVVNGKFAIYGTLGIKDSLQLNAGMTLRMGPGAIINGNGAVIDCAPSSSIMAFYLNGEDGNRCKIINTGDFGIGSWRTNPVDISYCDFVDCERINFYPVLADYVSIKHSAFINAPLYLDCEAYNNTFDITIDSCDFRGDGANLGAGKAYNIIYIYADYGTESTGSRRLDHCTFSSDSGAYITVRQKGFTISNSVLHNIQCGMSINYRKNFCVYDTVRDYTAITGFVGYVDSNIIYTNWGNPHLFFGGNGDTITNNLVYLTDEVTDGADIVLLTGITGNTYISGNLFWMQKDGAALNSLGYANSGTHTFTNNTIFTRFNGYGTVRNENGGRFTGTVNLFNNLLFNRSSNASSKFVYIETAGDNQIDYTDYNGFYDISDIYYQVTFDPSKEEGVDSGFGLSDLNINPQFYDTTRTIATFNSVVNGGDESYDSTTAYMLRLNGYDGTVSTKNIDTIYKWLSYGFRPTNDSIVNSGLDGDNIGAFDTIIAASEIDTVRKPNWPLEVITWDMAKAHPGVLYDFRLGVIGGEYPYKFELIEAPEGMIIDTVTGAILWNAPSSPSTTNAVDVKITDKKNDTLRHAWNIEVTATGFYFVDSLNGNDDNTGAIAAPFQTFDKAYKSLTRGDIVYLRDGTYHTDSGATFEGEHYPKRIMLTAGTPQIWLGYPGESVRLDGQYTGVVPPGEIELVFHDNTATARTLIQNVTFINTGYHTVNYWGTCGAIVRKCIFGPMTTSGHENPAYFFSGASSADITNMPRKRVIIQENEMANLQTNNAGGATAFYDVEKLLIEDNHIYNIGGNGINIKQKGYYCTIRGNKIENAGTAIMLMAQVGTEKVDVSHNLLIEPTDKAMYVGYQMGYLKDIYIHNNNITDVVAFRHNIYSSPESNNYNFYSNIIHNKNDVGLILESSGVLDSAKKKLKCDSNLYNCFSNGSPAVMMVSGLPSRYTLAQWQALSPNFDHNSQFKDPGLVNYEVPHDSSYFGLIGRDFYPESGWSGELPRLSGAKRVWTSTGSSDMNLATNYSGSGDLLTTDTLLFDNTSVVNSTATANLSVGMIYKTSAYTGNWSVSGRRVTLNTGDFIDSSTTGTVNYGLGFTFLGSNVRFENSSTNGSISGGQCAITANGHEIFYLKNNKKGLILRRLNVKSKTLIDGGESIGFNGEDSVLVIDTGDTISIISTLSLYATATGHPFVFGNNITIDGDGLLSIKNNTLSGSIDISLPKIVRRYGITQLVTGTQMATFIATDTINVYDFRVYPQIPGSNIITFNSGSKTMLFKHLHTGAHSIGTRSYCNFENSKLYVAKYTPFTVDSSFVNLTGCTIENPLSWGTYDKQVVTGSYQNSNVQDLLIGHSMVAEDTIREMGWFLKINHGDRSYVNKGVGGATIESALTRIDSCINAYHPDRVYIWYGANDIVGSGTIDSTFMDTTNAYFTRWSQLINICIDAGITDIRSVGLAPRGTVSEPMSDLSVQRYKYFNRRMADSCAVYNIYYIDVFDSMLLAGHDNVVDTLCATDGIHVNSTLYGTERVALLMTHAYIPGGVLTITTQPENDTVLSGQKGVFTVGYTGDSVQIAWYKNNVFTGVYGDTLRITGSNGDSVQAVLWNAEDTVSSSVAYLYVVGVPIDTTKIRSFDWINSSGNMFPASGWTIRVVRGTADTVNTTITSQNGYGFTGVTPASPLPVRSTAYEVLFINGTTTISRRMKISKSGNNVVYNFTGITVGL